MVHRRSPGRHARRRAARRQPPRTRPRAGTAARSSGRSPCARSPSPRGRADGPPARSPAAPARSARPAASAPCSASCTPAGIASAASDGRFGPRTRGAVTWFQIKHGLEPTGRVDAATLAELRTRRDPRVTLARTAEPTPTPRCPLSPWLPSAPASNLVGAVLLLLTLATTLALIALYWRRRPQAAPAEPLRPSTVSRTVLGYIVLDPDTDGAHERVAAATAAIATWCDARDWQLERVIHDAHHHPDDRPGLAYVMDRIRTGTACGIVVRHVSDLADSAPDLVETLQWINDADAFVMAVDEWLDPDLPPGRLSAGALVELGAWRNRRVGTRGLGCGPPRRPGAPRTGGRHARTGHVAAGHRRRAERRGSPHAPRREPLAAVGRPGPRGVQAAAGPRADPSERMTWRPAYASHCSAC